MWLNLIKFREVLDQLNSRIEVEKEGESGLKDA